MGKKRKSNHNSIRTVVSTSIVIPVFGAFDKLYQCLHSLQNQNLDTKIVLVDDASPTPLLNEIDKFGLNREFRQSLSVIVHKENKGFPYSCNHGAMRSGRSTYIVFMNSDIVTTPGWLEAMKGVFEKDPKVGVVGAKLIFPPVQLNDPERPAGKIQHAGIVFQPTQRPYHAFIGWNPDNPKVNQERELQAVTGALLMTRRDIFNTVGGFNLKYGKGTFEDLEYCFMVREHGYKVIYTPNAVAYHYTNASGQPFPIGPNFYLFKSQFSSKIIWDEAFVL